MKVSIAIPCWNMNGVGAAVLRYSLVGISNQTFKNFEVVVTDHSPDPTIEELCKEYDFVRYYRNGNNRGNPASNTNLGIGVCSGEYIKLLCQDDYLLDENSLAHCVNDIESSGRAWGFNSYVHTTDKVNLERRHVPAFNDNIHLINTLGTPSALIMKNGLNIWMDENLKYMYDCEFYKRVYDVHGLPNISTNDTMVNYIHQNQTTNTIVNNELVRSEEEYVRRKHQC